MTIAENISKDYDHDGSSFVNASHVHIEERMFREDATIEFGESCPENNIVYYCFRDGSCICVEPTGWRITR